MGNHEEFMIDFFSNKINNIKKWLLIGCLIGQRGSDIEVVDFIKDGFGDDIIDNLRNTLLDKIWVR